MSERFRRSCLGEIVSRRGTMPPGAPLGEDARPLKQTNKRRLWRVQRSAWQELAQVHRRCRRRDSRRLEMATVLQLQVQSARRSLAGSSEASSILSSAEAYVRRDKSNMEERMLKNGSMQVHVFLKLRVIAGGCAVATNFTLKRVAVQLPTPKQRGGVSTTRRSSWRLSSDILSEHGRVVTVTAVTALASLHDFSSI